jgi:hypothetical protein
MFARAQKQIVTPADQWPSAHVMRCAQFGPDCCMAYTQVIAGEQLVPDTGAAGGQV